MLSFIERDRFSISNVISLIPAALISRVTIYPILKFNLRSIQVQVWKSIYFHILFGCLYVWHIHSQRIIQVICVWILSHYPKGWIVVDLPVLVLLTLSLLPLIQYLFIHPMVLNLTSHVFWLHGVHHGSCVGSVLMIGLPKTTVIIPPLPLKLIKRLVHLQMFVLFRLDIAATSLNAIQTLVLPVTCYYHTIVF